MSLVKFQGTPVNTCGEIVKVGENVKDFSLVKADLSKASLEDFEGKNIVLNIFPSIDTPVCAASVRHFNKDASELNDTVVLCISKDLPFAQARFCGAEGLENVITLSDFINGQFGKDYGLEIIDSPLEGLLSRAVIILNKEGKVVYSELIEEITEEPNYEAALAAL